MGGRWLWAFVVGFLKVIQAVLMVVMTDVVCILVAKLDCGAYLLIIHEGNPCQI